MRVDEGDKVESFFFLFFWPRNPVIIVEVGIVITILDRD